MADRNPARLIAPLALVAAAVGVVVVIQASRPGTSDSGSAPPATQRTTSTVSTTEQRSPRARPRTYVVKAGDTLSLIADQAGVSLETIEELNPGLDPQALQTGQRLRLTP